MHSFCIFYEHTNLFIQKHPKANSQNFFLTLDMKLNFFSLTASRNTFIICTTTTISCSDRELWKIPWEACIAGVWLTAMWKFYFFYEIIIHFFSLSLFRLFFFILRNHIAPTMNFLEGIKLRNFIMKNSAGNFSSKHTMTEWWLVVGCDAFMSSSEHDVSIFSDGISNWHWWENFTRKNSFFYLF